MPGLYARRFIIFFHIEVPSRPHSLKWVKQLVIFRATVRHAAATPPTPSA